MTTVIRKSGSAATILVVDDDQSIRRLLRYWLELRGYRITEARDGDEAVEAAQRQPPDLILMDMNLMTTNGLVATNRIREIEGLREIPIVAMSGFSSEELYQAALAAGCREFVTKPIKFLTLIKLINRLLDKEQDE